MTRSTSPFAEELPRLLNERGLSLRAIARTAGVTHAHLSRAVRKADGKVASPDLTARVAEALGLPRDYFPEFRARFVSTLVATDIQACDRLYDLARAHTAAAVGSSS